MIFNSIQKLRMELAAQRGPKPEVELDNIVVPIDFSDCAGNALRLALAMAIRSGASLTLVHGIMLPTSMATEHMLHTNPLEEAEKASRMRLTEIAKEIDDWVENEKYSAINITIMVRTGFVAEEVVEVAKEEGADFIVMGTTGAGKIKGLLLGSTASHVLKKSKIPVLIVPETATYADISKIVFATDMVHTDLDCLEDLVRFTKVFGAELEVVHVMAPGTDLSVKKLEAFSKIFSEANDHKKTEAKLFESHDRNIVTAIQQFLMVESADAVAMLTHDRGFFDALLHQSLTRQMAHTTQMPLLALHIDS